MSKTILCDFWKNKKCLYMGNSKKCKYAHGEDDLNVIDCTYGVNCHNAICRYNHGPESTISNLVYDIPIIDKRKNKNVINIPEVNNTIIIDEKNKIKILEESNKLLIDKNKTLKDYTMELEIKNKENKKTINKIVIDNYKYIVNLRNKNKEILNDEKDKIIKQCTMELKNNLTEIQNKYNDLKNKYDNLKDNYNNLKNNYKTNIDKLIEENKILKDKPIELENKDNIINRNPNQTINKKNINKNKLKNIYLKYIKIYEIINKCKFYNEINREEIRKYSKDNNIYKLKQRSQKVYNYYNQLISGIIKEYLPVSKIFIL